MFSSYYLTSRAREAQSHLEHLARSGDFNALLHHNLAEVHLLDFETSPERTLRANAFHNALISCRSLQSSLADLRAAATTQPQNNELEQLQQKLEVVRKNAADYFAVHKSKNAKMVFEAVSGFLGVETALPARPGQARTLFGAGKFAIAWKDRRGAESTGVVGQQVPGQVPSGQDALQQPDYAAAGPPPPASFPAPVMAPPVVQPVHPTTGLVPVPGPPPLRTTAPAPPLLADESPVGTPPQKVQPVIGTRNTAPEVDATVQPAQNETVGTTPSANLTNSVGATEAPAVASRSEEKDDTQLGATDESAKKGAEVSVNSNVNEIGPDVPTLMPLPPRNEAQKEREIDKLATAV